MTEKSKCFAIYVFQAHCSYSHISWFSLYEYEKSICMMKTNIPEDMTIEVKSHEKQQQRFLKLECTGRHDFTSLWSTN